MGAKQSKRSVDISGKEAETAGEVAAAGAGGEGRVEPLADADAGADAVLKPQLNGDAHIQPPQDISDKEKQLDSGTPENEKDATTEKEGKEEQNEEKESTPVTNGDSEPKEENGDSVPTPEDGKKPKKEKVKKKWSLRSISFSRKDKPKQEKKPKEEEAKTNGEPEKVPEEAAEATAEPVDNKVADVTPTSTEVKEEKTPETPSTEPLTNGSSTPSSPAADAPAAPAPEPAAEPAAAAAPAAPAPAAPAPADTAPEQLPVNGLSLEEPKQEVPAVEPVVEESKPEEPTVVATETAPAPEIPVKTEVCDAKLPLIEPTPPPLPANPPPSSVASFAATTMAPELVEASLANTAENAILAPPAIPDTAADKPDESNFESHQTDITNLAVTQISPPLKEIACEDTSAPVTAREAESANANSGPEIVNNAPELTKEDSEIEIVKIEPEVEKDLNKSETESSIEVHQDENIKAPVETIEEADIPKAEPEVEKNIIEPPKASDLLEANKEATPVSNVNGGESVEAPSPVAEDANSIEEPPVDSCMDNDIHALDVASDAPNAIEDLPPPPPPEDDSSDRSEDAKPIISTESILKENILNDNHNVDTEANGITDETEQKNIKNKKVELVGSVVDNIECNGNGISSESGAASPPDSLSEPLPPPPSEPSSAGRSASPSPPPPEREDLPLQELPISDKIADLIPEIPTIPELKTETESAVAVAD